jgi:transcriptional regulator with XRE-family HTH domain
MSEEKVATKRTELFGNFLRKEILRIGLTQTQFAAEIGVALSTVTAWISGLNYPSEVKAWRKIVEILGWSQKVANSHWDKLMKELAGK